jgi:predicted ArsR family transcriptional regulator
MSIDALGALSEPVRRSIYEYAASRSEPVSRDDVADALGLGRTLAAFHLDKLAGAGLLEISYARRSGRSGPGAGRPAKLYRRPDTELAVSLPPRDYQTVADLLAEAVAEVGAEDTAYAVARRRGLAHAAVEPLRALADHGYEPVEDGPLVRLRNCPFARISAAHPPLVCGMNLALIQGLLGDGSGYVARLDPGPTGCCVVLDRVSNNNDD